MQFDDSFNPQTHFIELANVKQANNLAPGRGTAQFEIVDSQRVVHKALLTDALYVPSFKQSIFSLDRSMAQSARVEF